VPEHDRCERRGSQDDSCCDLDDELHLRVCSIPPILRCRTPRAPQAARRPGADNRSLTLRHAFLDLGCAVVGFSPQHGGRAERPAWASDPDLCAAANTPLSRADGRCTRNAAELRDA
jgi:hypothetical protein